MKHAMAIKLIEIQVDSTQTRLKEIDETFITLRTEQKQLQANIEQLQDTKELLEANANNTPCSPKPSKDDRTE